MPQRPFFTTSAQVAVWSYYKLVHSFAISYCFPVFFSHKAPFPYSITQVLMFICVGPGPIDHGLPGKGKTP